MTSAMWRGRPSASTIGIARGTPTGSPRWPLSWSNSRRTSSGRSRTLPRGLPSAPPRPFPLSSVRLWGWWNRGSWRAWHSPVGTSPGWRFPAIEVSGKRLELFKEAVPTISRVAVLVDPAQAPHADVPRNMAREAQALGVQLQRVEVGAPAAFEAAFAAMVQGGADALLIMEAPFIAAHRQQLLGLALQHQLPTMAYGRHFAEAGSLLAYGADPRVLCQRSAVFVQKILHGTKPADLPIERAEFKLVVNLKTAEALGVTIPPMFLFRADEVIK